MKFIKFILLGILFGVALTKSEVISWYRIYEMFRFQSFHMYGVIGSSIILGALGIQIIKLRDIKTIKGEPIVIEPKERSIARYAVGGIIFGLGWALTGACPGPLFILFGNGMSIYGLVILSAILGTYVYGRIKQKLPH